MKPWLERVALFFRAARRRPSRERPVVAPVADGAGLAAAGLDEPTDISAVSVALAGGASGLGGVGDVSSSGRAGGLGGATGRSTALSGSGAGDTIC